MNKTLALILSAALFGLSGTSVATPTNGNLTFTFSGNIPALAVGGTGWGFYEVDGVTGYVAPSSISLSASDIEDGIELTSASESFYIKPNAGSFTTDSQISAELTAEPTISGTAVQASELNTIDVIITLNGIEVPVGETTNIVTPTGSELQRLALGAKVTVPNAARSQNGGDIRVTTSLRLAADIS